VCIQAQNFDLQDDNYSTGFDGFLGNVTDNDGDFPGGLQIGPGPEGWPACFNIDAEGNLFLLSIDDCCGVHEFRYYLYEEGISQPFGFAFVTVEVDCGKPDCTFLDLEEASGGGSAGIDGPQHCLSACEGSTSTAFLAFDPSNTYDWSIVGGSGVLGAHAAMQEITWGTAGSGFISVIITHSDGSTEALQFCVDILPAPEANFAFTGVPCIGSNFQFNNQSIGGDSYLWNFGDNSPNSTQENPSHPFALAGTYTVSLTVYSQNFSASGKPLCCCEDVYELEVVVDPKPGPQIYCVSTLCAFDNASYWTDAADCATYVWTATDANGATVAILTGAGTDSINVDWGDGPFGTVTLQVTGCNPDLCEEPASVIIPIISTVGDIDGPDIVCVYEAVEYELPKWADTEYNWTVTGGGILSGQGTHNVQVFWGAGPVGTLHVEYSNSFLAGLPEHDPGDCAGVADFIVEILPKFTMDTQSLACVGQTTYLWGSTGGTGYSWNEPNGTSIYADSGNPNQGLAEWEVPGTFVVTATPLVSGEWCNAQVVNLVTVHEAPLPPTIAGETVICPAATETYTAVTTETGTTFNWVITGGVATGTTNSWAQGASVSVDWDVSGPYNLSLSQTMSTAPYCSSEPYEIQPTHVQFNGPYTLNGGPFCASSIADFNLTPLPDPASTVVWDIGIPLAGSFTGFFSPGGNNTQVQWNNYTGSNSLSVSVELCGQTLSYFPSDPINIAVVPNISQVPALCPLGTADLSVPAIFNSYSWNPGGSNPSSATTTIGNNGTYVVTTTDANGCEGKAGLVVAEVPGPMPVITSGDHRVICIDSPHTVTMVTPTNPDLVYQWYCNNVAQGFPTTTPSFTHPFAGVPGSWSYTVEAVNTLTGCSGTSDPFVVWETYNCVLPPCETDPFTPVLNIAQQSPNCNVFDYSDAGSTNFTATQWNFGDGNLALGQSGQHIYTQAGTYLVTMGGVVPEVPGPGNCAASDTAVVTVPIAADFSLAFIPGTCNLVQFTDLSTWMAGTGNAATSWTWLIATNPPVSGQNPLFQFPASSGSYNVTLIVENANGCQATISKTIDTFGVGNPSISVLPTGTVCAGEPLQFGGNSTGAIGFSWDFGDGSTLLGENGIHTFENNTSSNITYTVALTVSGAENCTQTTAVDVIVTPGVPAGIISVAPAVICAGDMATLTAPAGYSYTWSHDPLWPTNTVDVGAGMFSVLLEDANGCTRELDEVEVVELAAPVASISGPSTICGSACIDLEAPFSWPMNYQWNVDGAPITGATNYNLSVCDTDFPAGTTSQVYTVYMENDDGCSDLSAVFTVQLADLPSFTVNTTPSPACAGDIVTMTAYPADPSLDFSWSTGASGPSLTTTVAGTYHLLGLDPATGCFATDYGVVHALPDLCPMPAGCYEICNPDTVCAPSGLASYQWMDNGLDILGAIDSCLIVTESGNYAVAVVDGNGCESTSALLDLEVIDCSDSTDCAYFDNVELFCVNGKLYMSFDICNPLTAGFTVNQVDISASAPAGVTISPGTLGALDFAPAYAPLAPGDCAYGVQVQIFGSYTPGQALFFSMEAADGDLVCPMGSFGADMPPCGVGPCSDDLHALWGSTDDCCIEVGYTNGQTNIAEMVISCAQADLDFDFLSLDANHTVNWSNSSAISISGNPSGSVLAAGVYPSLIDFCIENPVSLPQMILIEWFDTSGAFACSDSVFVQCVPEPSDTCALITNFTIFCEQDQVMVSFKLCNPATNTLPIYSLDIVSGVAGVTFSPSQFTLSSPLMPGDCIVMNSNVAGPGLASSALLCFEITTWNDATGPPCLAYEDCVEVPPCPGDPPTSDCLFIAADTVWCEAGQTYYSFTACNPATASFDVHYIVLDVSSPASITVNPAGFVVSPPLLAGGPCQSYTVQLDGPTPFSETFCYRLVGHAGDPTTDLSVLCCSDTVDYCIDLPGCDPCVMTWVEFAPLDDGEGDECCFAIDAVNGFDGYLNGIQIDVLSPNTSISQVNSLPGSSWAVSSQTPTSVSLELPAGTIPLGNVQGLPTLCTETTFSPYQDYLISWLADGEVVCQDTVSVYCAHCGYAVEQSVDCVDGVVTFTGYIHNNADYIIEEVAIQFSSAGMGIYNEVIPIAPLAPGDISQLISFDLGAPAMAGDTVIINVFLHELSASGNHLNCCDFKMLVIIPPCDGNEGCYCDDNFFDAVAAGFTSTPNAASPLDVDFSFNDNEIQSECDLALWIWDDGTTSMYNGPATGASHIYAAGGEYEVCVKVSRTATDGARCKHYVCTVLGVEPMVGMEVRAFPNPSDGRFALECGPAWSGEVALSVRGLEGRVVRGVSAVLIEEGELIWVDLQNEPAGIYTITLRSSDGVVTVRAVVN
jgi:PKD repeat protein